MATRFGPLLFCAATLWVWSSASAHASDDPIEGAPRPAWLSLRAELGTGAALSTRRSTYTPTDIPGPQRYEVDPTSGVLAVECRVALGAFVADHFALSGYASVLHPTDAGADWPLYWSTLVALGPEVTAFLRDDHSGAFLRGRGAYVREPLIGSNAFFGFGFGGTAGYAWALPNRRALSTGLDVAATWLHAEEAGDFGDYQYRYRIVSVAGVVALSTR